MEQLKKTDQHTQDGHTLSNEHIVSIAIQKAAAKRTSDESINTLLACLGTSMHADRFYIFEFEKAIPAADTDTNKAKARERMVMETEVSCTYEWCAEGVVPLKDRLQNIPTKRFGGEWMRDLVNKKDVFIRDMAPYRDADPAAYDHFQANSTFRIILTPLFLGDHLIGFFGADNPQADTMDSIGDLFHMLASFTVTVLRTREERKSRERMYEEDPVTGTLNMSAFLRHVEEIRKKKPADSWKDVSIIYFNVSTFRIYNDTFGIGQGDKCLRAVSDIIRAVFNTTLTARFYADHFLVYYTKDDYIEKVTACHEKVLGLETNFQLWLKAGIVHPDPAQSVSAWCDDARIACDAISRKGLDFYRIYERTLSDDLIRKKYLQDSIDAAIRHGNILIYYQPIVRTLTEKVTSFEALVRWDDPVYGFLSPDVFVPALEERHLSYKLDMYVAKKVCEDLGERKRNGLPTVPVSVNFSRRDFAACDVLEIVEGAVKENELSHSDIIIEITESAAMEDPETVHDFMDRFHHAGYQVWMDDFGSAYSSLNALNSFDFDEIKLDMVFMQKFEDRTRKILNRIVNMAKDLHIHTLCEGVETSEQVQFLREIGCEKIQGFYYGRPLPLEEQWENLLQKKTPFETEPERALWDSFGLMVFPQNQMFMVLTSREGTICDIYCSEKMREHFEAGGYHMTVKHIEDAVNDRHTAMSVAFRRTVNRAMETKEPASSFIAIGSGTYRFEVRCVGRTKDTALLWCTCQDFTSGTLSGEEKYSGILRNIIDVYHTVYRLDFEKRRLEVIRSIAADEKQGEEITDFPDKKLSDLVWWEDRKKFDDAFQEDFITENIKKSESGYFTMLVRMKYSDGAYLWTEIMFIGVLLEGKPEYLCCMKKLCAEENTPYEVDLDMKALIKSRSMPGGSADGAFGGASDAEGALALQKSHRADETSSGRSGEEPITTEDLWTSLLHQADIELFWKDTKSRIMGASDSYFRRRHVAPEEVIGRDDHTLGWHINDQELVKGDVEVLEHGHVLYNRPEDMIRDGRVHHVLISRFPVYHRGQIRGIMGYLLGAPEEEMEKMAEIPGGISGIGFLHAYAGYENDYMASGEDYSLAVVYIPECHRVEHTCGREAALNLRKKIMDLAGGNLGSNAVLGLITEDIMVVLSRSSRLDEETAAWCSHMNEIHTALGHPCTVEGFYGVEKRSSVTTPYQMYASAIARLTMYSAGYERLSVEALRLRIDDYRKIFDSVILVDPGRLKRIVFDGNGYARDAGNCWEVLGGTSRCVNCIVAKTLRTKEKAMKLEYIAGAIYIMRTFYVEVDGTPYVIECAQQLDEDLFEEIGGKSAIAQQLQKLNYEVYTDKLTGIRNRRFYDEQLSDSTAEAVAFMDIDDFKHFNDTYGHHTGDLVLQSLVHAVLPALKSGEYLTRYGGDEFVIVYEKVESRDGLLRSLEQIQENITNIRISEEGMQGVRISASIGAFLGRGVVREMILRADHALYQVKATGKGKISVEEG